MTLRLSAELWDRVIDCLHGDKPSLKHTSLVCKAWTPSSHFHLFYSVQFHNGPSSLQFITEAPHLVACVRSLTLSNLGQSTVRELCAILHAIPNLIRLSFNFSCPKGQPPRSYRARPIPQLEFANCAALGNEVFDILSIFTSIEHLSFYMAGELVSGPQTPMLSQPTIRKLSAERTTLSCVHPVICSTSAVEHLETFSLRGIDTWYEVSRLSEVLSTLRSTLLHLELAPNLTKSRYFAMQPPALMWEGMKLSQCNSLQSLKLSSHNPANIIATLKAYLAAYEVAPPSLRAISMHLHSLPERLWLEDLDPAWWDAMDRMLLASHGQRDVTVTLELYGQSERVSRLKAFVVESLPGAVQQGRLLVIETTRP